MPEVRPIARYPRPRYPDAGRALQNPELLRRLPARFAAKPAVRAALGAVLSLGLAGCGRAAEPSPILPAPSPAPTAAPSPALAATPSSEPAYAAQAIPLFEHGYGMGSYGCVSVAPPVFLSEEEAAEAIRDEMARYGLDFSAGKTLADAELPLHNTFPIGEDQGSPLGTAAGELALDGYSESLGIGFEFVSREDLSEWQDPKQEAFASVESYFFKDAAQAIADGNENVAAFYDPMSADYSEFNYEWPEEDDGGQGYREYAEQYDAAQREKSLEDLRAQVRGFLEWLKGQGVI